MKIILTEKDVEAIIKKEYPNMKEVVFNPETLEVVLNMDLDELKSLTKPTFNNPDYVGMGMVETTPIKVEKKEEKPVTMNSGRGSNRPLEVVKEE